MPLTRRAVVTVPGIWLVVIAAVAALDADPPPDSPAWRPKGDGYRRAKALRLRMRSCYASVSMDDAALIAGLKAGDNAVFETLVRTYGGRLLATARRMLHNDEDARDAVQDAFINAFRSRESFKGDSLISTWLHSIVVNSSLMKLRTRRRKPEEQIENYLPRFLPDGHHTQLFPSWTEPADVALSRKETAEMVRSAIEELPETYRTVVLLRDIEGLSTEETAKIVNTTPNAVKIRLHRGRLALRTLIAPHMVAGAHA